MHYKLSFLTDVFAFDLQVCELQELRYHSMIGGSLTEEKMNFFIQKKFARSMFSYFKPVFF